MDIKDDTDALEKSLIENLQRSDLSSVERENAINDLWKSGNYKTKEKLANKLGVSPTNVRTYITAKKDREELSSGPDVSTSVLDETRSLPKKIRKNIIKKVQSGEISTRKVREEVKKIKQKELNKEKVKIISVMKDKYNIIYADPPWQYWEGGDKNQSQHYSTMTMDDIKQLPIQDLTADNCILFLWTTRPIILEMKELLDAWGFKYSTIGFVWVKSKKDGTGFAFGNGNWTRANAEYCIIATKGSVPRQDASISEIIYEPKGKHSQKPSIVRDKIVQLVGDIPRIELFARQKTEGWDVWGNEV